MTEMTVAREVAADAARVWAVVVDLDRWEQVVSGIERVERLDAGADFGVGTRWRETRKLAGKRTTEELAVTAVEPGRSYTVEADSHGTHYRSTVAVEPLADGRSRLSMTFAGEPQGLGTKVLAATIGKLFERSTRAALQRDLDDLAAAAQRPT